MEKECRICFEKTKEPLINPCKCSGSMKWVHKSCLDKWLHFKKSNICPVCKSEFTYSPYTHPLAKFASFIIKSELITTIITFLITISLCYFCVTYNISPNVLAFGFFGLIFGMNYIQEFFNHKEIDFEFLFETICSYSHNSSSNCFCLICLCIWQIIDKLKYKLCSNFLELTV
jgi:E3 ubiquitin-protein ligase DOA10